MSDRERRPSTIKATESQLERSKTREEIEKSKKISSNLKHLIKKEQAELNKSVIELWNLSAEPDEELEPTGLYLETPNLQGIEALPKPLEKAPLISVLEQLSDFENSDNLYLDPLHAVKSPSGSDHILEQIPVFVNPESPGFGDIDSPDSLVVRRDSGDSSDWSPLNQFFPPGCLQTPQLQLRPERGASVGSHLLPSPSVLPSIREGDNTSSSKTVQEVLSDNFETQDKMENHVLKTRLDAVAAAADKVERRLCNFGPEDVTLEDMSSYKEYLDEMR